MSFYPPRSSSTTKDKVWDNLRVENTLKLPPNDQINPNFPVPGMGNNDPVTNVTLRSTLPQAGAIVYCPKPIARGSSPDGCLDGKNHLYFSDGNHWIPLANCPSTPSDDPLYEFFVCARAGEQVKVPVVTDLDNPVLSDHTTGVDLDSVVIDTKPAHGKIVEIVKGVITYQADVRYLGPDWFTFEVTTKSGKVLDTQVTVDIVSPLPPLATASGNKLRFIYAVGNDTWSLKCWTPRQVKEYNNGVKKLLFTPEEGRVANGLATNRDDNVVYYAWDEAVWAYDYLRDMEFKVAEISADPSSPFSDAVKNQGGPVVVKPHTGGTYHNGVYYFGGNKADPGPCTEFKEIEIDWEGKTDFDLFGWSVSINGDYAIVGMPGYDDPILGNNTGAAYIFKKNSDGTWPSITDPVGVAKLEGKNNNDYFGNSVSINGDYAIVGARSYDSFTGRAYIYGKAGGWDSTPVILENPNPTITNADKFGNSVSINGDYAIVGARGYDDPILGNSPGAAYIFKKDNGGTWSEVAGPSLLEGKTADDQFGNSVSINGDYAFVGAYEYDSFTGAAYIYKKDNGGTWSEVVGPSLLEGKNNSDYFGRSVSINGDYAIVGAPGYDDPILGNSPGAAYIFKKDNGGTWSEVPGSPLVGENDADNFGWSVSINGDYAIVGAYRYDGNKGAAYIYNRECIDGKTGNPWGLVSDPLLEGKTADDYFGYSVSISGDYAIVGADNYALKGAAYLYNVERPGLAGYYRAVMAPYEREDGKPPAQKILDVNFIPWSDNKNKVGSKRELGDLAYNPNSGTLMVVSNAATLTSNPNQIAICDPSSGEILHKKDLSITGKNNEITWDASGAIVLSQYTPTTVGSKIRSLNTGTGYAGPVLGELEEENIWDLAEWISQPCEK